MFALRPWHLLTRARYKHWLFTKTLGCCTVMLAELGRFSVGIIDGEPYWGGASFTLGYIFDFSIFLHWTRLDCSTVASFRCSRLGRLLRLLLAVELESRTPYNVCRYLRTVVCMCVCFGVCVHVHRDSLVLLYSGYSRRARLPEYVL